MLEQTHLPDIAKTQTQTDKFALKWVGMENIAIPISLQDTSNESQAICASSNIFVSLDDKEEKGIHMSRLHAIINKLSELPCNKKTIDSLLEELVVSQKGISNSAKIDLKFDLILDKKSLLSDESGYQTYCVEINAQKREGQFDYNINITIPYSSTCPCSAALARQLQAEAFVKSFPSESISQKDVAKWLSNNSIATPHSQRSYAYINLAIGNNPWPSIDSLINKIEETMSTAVQTMVKRIDEQEFARLNAENLMFCEDSARKLKSTLESFPWLVDYHFKIEHQESLHAHNAVVIDQK